MRYKTCTKCGEVKEATLEFFYKNKHVTCGLQADCKTCRKNNVNKYREENHETCQLCSKNYTDKHKIENIVRATKWNKSNKEKRAIIVSRWQKNNPDKNAAKSARHKAKKLSQTPPDANNEQIQLIYEVCQSMGPDFNVDHIHPLQAVDGSKGLHHEDNLQILGAVLNKQKGARWPLTKEEEVKYNGFKVMDLTSLEQ